MGVLERYFENKQNEKKSILAFKQVCIGTFKKLFDDSNSEVRESALKTIGKFNKIKDFFTNDEIGKKKNNKKLNFI